MTRLVHSPEAAQDLEELVDFLRLNRPEYAVETVDLVLDALSVLEPCAPRHACVGDFTRTFWLSGFVCF